MGPRLEGRTIPEVLRPILRVRRRARIGSGGVVPGTTVRLLRSARRYSTYTPGSSIL